MSATVILGATVQAVRTNADRRDFERWLVHPRRALAVDTETAGLRWHDPVRLVQFGDCDGGWAIDPNEDLGLIEGALAKAPRLVVHSAQFDLPRLARLLGDWDPKALLDRLARKTLDTRLMAHVLDPRGREVGAVGHALKDLAAAHLDCSAADSQKILKDRFKQLRLKDGWAEIDVWDDAFWTYGVMDTVLTARLLEAMGPQVNQRSLGDLVKWEHHTQRLTMAMSMVGIAVDLPLAYAWDEDLGTRQERHEATAASMGVANVNSTRQVAAALAERGVVLTEVTDSGETKVDKKVLAGANDPLADAVLAAKKAAKSRTMVATIIEHGEADGRVHASINSLRAITARMSVQNPALQTLSAQDWEMRSLLIADPGEVFVSADYAAIELRVVAALAQEPSMMAAFKAGEDIHQSVADRLGIERKVAKAVNFATIYGGGAETIARQADIDKVEAGAAVHGFKREYARFQKWSRSLQDSIQFSSDGILTTRTGRPIPIDRNYSWRACNYAVQSAARDVLCGALTELDKANLIDPVRLPIHDELLCSVAEDEAEDYLRQLTETMSGVLDGVDIVAEGAVIGRAWGDAYRPKAPDG